MRGLASVLRFIWLRGILSRAMGLEVKRPEIQYLASVRMEHVTS